MNRIILIGNGFDLAHGLPTSYKDFIEDYWAKWPSVLKCCKYPTQSDGLCTLTINSTELTKLIGDSWNSIIMNIYHNNVMNTINPAEIIEQIKKDNKNFNIIQTHFFHLINQSIELKNWVDIENVYYTCLKGILNTDFRAYKTPKQLDDELDIIRGKLIIYLKTLQDERIIESIKKECIQTRIFEPFCIDDISIEKRRVFQHFVETRWSGRKSLELEKVKYISSNYGYFEHDLLFEMECFEEKILKKDETTENILKRKDLPKYYLLPDDVLILNFNYTCTAEIYIPENSNLGINHIHGTLKEPNKIIFGYGDELDDDYKKLSNLNNNDFLQNIKSIRYLETDNYRQLLRFIDSAPYQIYIMGHSCGNSDRTLLNTLFEHQNCVSIKPFYHQRADGSDNYIEIIQNISRNFNSMQMMRDRVVNKTYCRPLVNPA